MKLVVAVAALGALLLSPVRAADWPTFGFDSARSGFNTAEKTLTAGDVAKLHQRWQFSFGSVADSTPIYVHVHSSSQNVGVLYQTTKSGTTYAIEAKTGKMLWQFTTQGYNITASTPVADPGAGLLFVPGVDGYVHELNLVTGAELHDAGFPAQITLLPKSEKDASSLNLANGHLYATTSGYYGDATPYVGHVVSVRLRDGETVVFNSLCSKTRGLPRSFACSQQRSGIWGRGGAVVDPDPSMKGRVYVATGNGDFNAAHGGDNYGDSALSLTQDLRLVDSYTPGDNMKLDDDDIDLGSTSPVMLPRQSNSSTPLMMTQGGKDAILRLIDRTHMGGVNGEMQKVNMPAGLFTAPAVWTDPNGTVWLFLGFSGGIQSYKLQTSSGGRTRLVTGWSASSSGSSDEGTSPVVANGVVFYASSGAIQAFDAKSGAQLWSSVGSGAGGSIGSIHWESPIVVDGAVYCSDENGNLTAYSLAH